MAVARMAYIICDECGAAAAEPEDTVSAARRMMPLSWVTVTVNRRKRDYCPAHAPGE